MFVDSGSNARVAHEGSVPCSSESMRCNPGQDPDAAKSSQVLNCLQFDCCHSNLYSRTSKDRQNYNALLAAVVSLQANSRSRLARRRFLAYRESYKRALASVLVIQAVVRRKLAMTRSAAMLSALVIVQAGVRGRLATRHYNTVRSAILSLQSFARMAVF